MATPNYKCTEQELYTICETAWNSCEEYLTNFTAFKAKYNLAFTATKKTAITTARNLPDEQQRNFAYETASIELRKQGRACCDKWQLLKRYIADAYPEDQQKPMLEAAGSNYYSKAAQNNWDSVKGLITNGSTFIALELPQLTANNNMPPAFQTEFDLLKTNFETQHQTFLQAEELSRVGQETKMNANNTIFADLMPMLLDGQEIFKNNESLYKQFVFAELLYLASGTGTAGVKGHVTSAPANTPLQNVKVGIPAKNKIVQTNETGFYQFLQLAAGKYTITFELEGYQTHTEIQFDIKVGTVSTLNVELTPNP